MKATINLDLHKFQTFIFPEASHFRFQLLLKIDGITYSSSVFLESDISKQKLNRNAFTYQLFLPPTELLEGKQQVFALLYEVLAIKTDYKRTFDRQEILFNDEYKIVQQSLEATIAFRVKAPVFLQPLNINILVPNIRINESAYFFDKAELVLCFDELKIHQPLDESIQLYGNWHSFIKKCELIIPSQCNEVKIKLYGYSSQFPAHQYYITQFFIDTKKPFTSEVPNVKVSKNFILIVNLNMTNSQDRNIQKIKELLNRFPFIVDSYYSVFEEQKEVRPQRAFVNIKVEGQVANYLDNSLPKNPEYLDATNIRVEFNGVDLMFKLVDQNSLVHDYDVKEKLGIFGVTSLLDDISNETIRKSIFSYQFIKQTFSNEQWKYIIVSTNNIGIESDQFCLYSIFHELAGQVILISERVASFYLQEEQNEIFSNQDFGEAFNFLYEDRLIVLNLKVQFDLSLKNTVRLNYEQDVIQILQQHLSLFETHKDDTIDDYIMSYLPFEQTIFKLLVTIKQKWQLLQQFDRKFPILKIPRSHISKNQVVQFILLLDHIYTSYYNELFRIENEQKLFDSHKLVSVQPLQITPLMQYLTQIGLDCSQLKTFKNMEQLEKYLQNKYSISYLLQCSEKLKDKDFLNNLFTQQIAEVDTFINNTSPWYLTEKNFSHSFQCIVSAILQLQEENQRLEMRKFAQISQGAIQELGKYFNIKFKTDDISQLNYRNLATQITQNLQQQIPQFLQLAACKEQFCQLFKINADEYGDRLKVLCKYLFDLSLLQKQSLDDHESIQLLLIVFETLYQLKNNIVDVYTQKLYRIKNFAEVVQLLRLSKLLKPQLIDLIQDDIEIQGIITVDKTQDELQQFNNVIRQPNFQVKALNSTALPDKFVQLFFRNVPSNIQTVLDEKLDDAQITTILIYLDALSSFKKYLDARLFADVQNLPIIMEMLKSLGAQGIVMLNKYGVRQLDDQLLSHNTSDFFIKLINRFMKQKVFPNFMFLVPYSQIVTNYYQEQFIEKHLPLDEISKFDQTFLQYLQKATKLEDLDQNVLQQIVIKVLDLVIIYDQEFAQRVYFELKFEVVGNTLQELTDILNFKRIIQSKEGSLHQLPQLVEEVLAQRDKQLILQDITQYISQLTQNEKEVLFQLEMYPFGDMKEFYSNICQKDKYLQVQYLFAILLYVPLPKNLTQDIPALQKSNGIVAFHTCIFPIYRYFPYQLIDYLLWCLFNAINDADYNEWCKTLSFTDLLVEVDGQQRLSKVEKAQNLLKAFQRVNDFNISQEKITMRLEMAQYIYGLNIVNHILYSSFQTLFIHDFDSMMQIIKYHKLNSRVFYLFQIYILLYQSYQEYYILKHFQANISEDNIQQQHEPFNIFDLNYVGILNKLIQRLIYLDDIRITHYSKIFLQFDGKSLFQFVPFLKNYIRLDSKCMISPQKFENHVMSTKQLVQLQQFIKNHHSSEDIVIVPQTFNQRMKMFVDYIQHSIRKGKQLIPNHICQYSLYLAFQLNEKSINITNSFKFDFNLNELELMTQFLLLSKIMSPEDTLAHSTLGSIFNFVSSQYSYMVPTWIWQFIQNQKKNTIYQFLPCFPQIPYFFLRSFFVKSKSAFGDKLLENLQQLKDKSENDFAQDHIIWLFLFLIVELQRFQTQAIVLPKLNQVKVHIAQTFCLDMQTSKDVIAQYVYNMDEPTQKLILDIESGAK